MLALTRMLEYRLVVGSVTNYTELGYHDGAGNVTLVRLLTHIVIDDLVKAAEREEQNRSMDKAIARGGRRGGAGRLRGRLRRRG